MKKLLLLVLVFFYSFVQGSEIQDYDFHLSPSNIKWVRTDPPKDITDSKVYKDWVKELPSENPPIRWSRVHITSKDSVEIILQEGVGGSGGLNTIVLQQNGTSWKKLVDIFGGFIFFPVPSKSNTLVVYERMGYKYRNVEYKLFGNSYKEVSVREIPTEVTDRNGQDVMFYYFWYMNNGLIPEKKSRNK
ncbi:hypothetical protein G6703_02195 [Polynucleobacter paneuropaeus]|nr:hypothetical protein G6703_02195 [Polynucleobacter paneuropaeus]